MGGARRRGRSFGHDGSIRLCIAVFGRQNLLLPDLELTSRVQRAWLGDRVAASRS